MVPQPLKYPEWLMNDPNQLAQNIALSYLAGARIQELKTVQIMDELEIPRPCIHAPNVGLNVEWSQELLVEQSAAEYAKGWLLVHMLASEHGPGRVCAPTFFEQ